MKRIVIAAGGTGGHFYPGLVVARALRERGWEPLMIVRKGDPAGALLERDGIAYLPIDLRGLPRHPGPALLEFGWKLASSFRTLSRALRAFRPDLALGMGGYLTFPLICSAWRRNVPRAVHESNAILGLANHASLWFGAKLYWGLPPASPTLADALVGTPIRPAIWARRDAAQARSALGLETDRATILVFGGSQGATGLNDSLPQALASVPEAQVLLISGKGKEAAAADSLRALGTRVHVREYVEEMENAYGAADVVICRSGASTLAELIAQRLPAILVPYPHASANHQEANARILERAGAAICIPEIEIRSHLGPVLRDLFDSNTGGSRRKSMSQSYSHLTVPAASQTVSGFVTALERMVAL